MLTGNDTIWGDKTFKGKVYVPGYLMIPYTASGSPDRSEDPNGSLYICGSHLRYTAGGAMHEVARSDTAQTFSGSVEDVWLSVNRFFGEFVPTFEVAKMLVLSVDMQELVKACEGLIAFSAEGTNLLVPRGKLTDNETLGLLLLASYVGFQLGKLNSDVVLRDELQVRLGKDAKIVSTRLGELVKGELAVKTADEKYKITTFGIAQMQKEILPKIRAKISQ
jgi:hypothetical protein